MSRRFFLLALLILLASCSSAPPRPGPGESPAQRPDEPVLRPGELSRETPRAPNAAVDSLLDRSLTLARAGQTDDALVAAERAQRLAPRDPRVYYRLATLRLSRGEREQAEQLALKGLSLGPDQALRDELRQLLQKIRAA